MRALVAGVLIGLVVGCRRPPPPAPPVGGPTLVEIRGTISALDGLPAVKGILISGRGQEQLADGTWAVQAYLSSPELVDVLHARGLAVKVLQTPEQMARESEELARQLKAREPHDGSAH